MGDAGRAAVMAVWEGLRGAGNSGGRERRFLCNGHPAGMSVDGGLMLRRGFVPAAAAADSSPVPAEGFGGGGEQTRRRRGWNKSPPQRQPPVRKHVRRVAVA